MARIYAGLDVSTQSTKLVVVDLDSSHTVYSGQVNYDKDLPQYGTLNGTQKAASYGVSESDPKMWLDALDLIFSRARDKNIDLKSIIALSVSGQQHGLVTLTADGELSRPMSKLWNDFSTGEECDLLTEAVGGVEAMIGEVGNSQRTGYTAPKIFHMARHEPENYAKTATVFLVHNFINWHLTGGKNGGVVAMEPGDVSGSALWNPKTRTWSAKVIDAIDPELREKLPPVKPSRQLIGKIGPLVAEQYGLGAGCIIASGSGDNMMGAIGTGNYVEGVVTVSIGTSGTAYSFMKEPYVDPDGEIASFCDATGNYLPLLCISNLANGYEAILRRYNLSHEDFERAVARVPPGNNGRVLCPWYEGERTPDLPEAAPVYFGFGLDDFTQETLCRAVLEGHIMNLFEGFQRLPVTPSEIRLTGGISKSKVWREVIANIFNCKVVPVLGEGAALGAALHAAWSAENHLTINEIADPFIVLDRSAEVLPDPELVAVYGRFKRLYLAVSRNIRGLEGENPFKIYKEFQPA